jgi:cerevisin
VRAALVEEFHPHGTVENSYIISFRNDITPGLKDNHLNFLQAQHAASPLAADENCGLKHVYSFGYAGCFDDGVIEQIRSKPEVDFVERDQIVRISNETFSDSVEVQRGAPWGLARISHRKRLSLSTFTKYEYVASGGEGVNAYIIDTGIYVDHKDFQGRAHWGVTIPANDVDEDANGHGTHCAGTIASKTYGVAKKAHVYAVKVLGSNGSGTMSDVIAGVEWAVEDANKQAKAGKVKGSVANMSLGGGKSPSLDNTVNAASKAGLPFAVAAGNENADACKSSPAAAEEAVTVGASTITDERAYFSNYGECVDVFAPGLNIKSTWNDGRTNTISGTSMASPHTAGLIAYLISIHSSSKMNPEVAAALGIPIDGIAEQSSFATMYTVAYAALPHFIARVLPSPAMLEAIAPIPTPEPLTAQQLKTALLTLSTPGALTDLPKGTPNLLIFNNATA